MQPSGSDKTNVSPRLMVTSGGPTATSIAICSTSHLMLCRDNATGYVRDIVLGPDSDFIPVYGRLLPISSSQPVTECPPRIEWAVNGITQKRNGPKSRGPVSPNERDSAGLTH